ncbi:cyclin-domain-containing protein [Flagelloscypha sp. PMI_526]|nr:cyclin-domain-containing protein [Flagelloscypha sp. PMI_526]
MAAFSSLYTPPTPPPMLDRHSLPAELMHLTLVPPGPVKKLPGVANLILPPLTPPEDVPMHTVAHELYEAPLSRPVTPTAPIDFLANPTANTSHFFAEKTCEMICYMWFSPPKQPSDTMDVTAYPSPTHSPVQSQELFKEPASSWTVRLNPTPTFIQFMQKLLETTQVSQSVIVLSLHYIYRLKTSAQGFGAAQPGSEFRVAVVALMMANKFLDDNTYTNQTWSSISSIPLVEINKMELEFLDAAGWNLYVAHTDYKSWQKMLMGLVNARETEQVAASPHVVNRPPSYSQPRHRSTSPPAPSSASSLHPGPQFVPRSANRNSWTHSNPYPTPPYSHPSAPSYPELSQSQSLYELGAKRPPSPELDSRPSKRLSLQIPSWSYSGHSSASSANPSPLEGFAHNFGRMSLAGGGVSAGPSPHILHNQLSYASTPASTYSNGVASHGQSQVLIRPHACHSPSEGAKGKKGRLLYQPTASEIPPEYGQHTVHPTVTGAMASFNGSPAPYPGATYQYTPPQPGTCRLPPISTFHTAAAASRGSSPSLSSALGQLTPSRTTTSHSHYGHAQYAVPSPSSHPSHHHSYSQQWQNRPVQVGAFANNGPPGVWRTL